MEIVFHAKYNHRHFLVPGCIYAVKGKYLNKSLVLTVDEVILPPSMPEQKHSLIKHKFKVICDNINFEKKALNF